MREFGQMAGMATVTEYSPLDIEEGSVSFRFVEFGGKFQSIQEMYVSIFHFTDPMQAGPDAPFQWSDPFCVYRSSITLAHKDAIAGYESNREKRAVEVVL